MEGRQTGPRPQRREQHVASIGWMEAGGTQTEVGAGAGVEGAGRSLYSGKKTWVVLDFLPLSLCVSPHFQTYLGLHFLGPLWACTLYSPESLNWTTHLLLVPSSALTLRSVPPTAPKRVLEHQSPVSPPLLRPSPPLWLASWISFLLLPPLIPTNLAALTAHICHLRFWFGSPWFETETQVAVESESLWKDRHLLIWVWVDPSSCPRLLPQTAPSSPSGPLSVSQTHLPSSGRRAFAYAFPPRRNLLQAFARLALPLHPGSCLGH